MSQKSIRDNGKMYSEHNELFIVRIHKQFVEFESIRNLNGFI